MSISIVNSSFSFELHNYHVLYEISKSHFTLTGSCRVFNTGVLVINKIFVADFFSITMLTSNYFAVLFYKRCDSPLGDQSFNRMSFNHEFSFYVTGTI